MKPFSGPTEEQKLSKENRESWLKLCACVAFLQFFSSEQNRELPRIAWWTKEDVKELVRFGRARSSLDELAETFNRSHRAIKAKTKRVDLDLAASKIIVTRSLDACMAKIEEHASL